MPAKRVPVSRLQRMVGCAKQTIQRITSRPGFPIEATIEEQAKWVAERISKGPQAEARLRSGAEADGVEPAHYRPRDLREAKLALEIKKLQEQLSEHRRQLEAEILDHVRDEFQGCLRRLRREVDEMRLTDEQRTRWNAAVDAATRFGAGSTSD